MIPVKSQIFFFGFLFHLLAAFFSIGYHQCDELFQVFEFAGYKLGLNRAGEMPWEFTADMRSGLLPMLVYLTTKMFYALGIYNSFHIATFLRFVMSILSFFAVVRCIRMFEREIVQESGRLWLWFGSLLFWCVPYFHARLSSENASSTLFLLGLGFVLTEPKSERRGYELLAGGFLLGLSFICRFHQAFMIAGLFAWLLLVQKAHLKKMGLLLLGIFAALLAGLLIDRWLYAKWTLSWWNYLAENVLNSKADVYGTEPFYFFVLESLIQLIPPFSILIIACIAGFWISFKRHVVTWMTLPFVLLHFMVGHKELRFLFPLINFLPFMLALSIQKIGMGENGLLKLFFKKGLVRLALGVNAVALLLFTFKPADNVSLSLSKIWSTTRGKAPLLLYEGSNPYNNLASLGYFRKPGLRTLDLDSASADLKEYDRIYFFSEKTGEADRIVKNGMVFVKIYSSFPGWVINYFNVNGWVDRAGTFSIFEKQSSGPTTD